MSIEITPSSSLLQPFRVTKSFTTAGALALAVASQRDLKNEIPFLSLSHCWYSSADSVLAFYYTLVDQESLAWNYRANPLPQSKAYVQLRLPETPVLYLV